MESDTKAKAPNINVKVLKEVYYKYGSRSKEFHKHIFPFIVFLINRYYPQENQADLDDMVAICYEKVHKSLGHFNESKGNLATFLYTTIRNIITNTRTKNQRYAGRNALMTDLGIESNEVGDTVIPNVSPVGKYGVNEVQLKRAFNKLVLSDNFIRDYCSGKVKSELVDKVVLWSNITSIR